MKAVILAAGLGTRMGNIGKEIPKCLLVIGNRTVLEIQIELLQNCGIKLQDITVVIGNTGTCWTQENQRKIKTLHYNVLINPLNHLTHNAHSLKLALDSLNDDDDILIIDGDVLISEEIADFMVHTRRNLLLSKLKETHSFEGNKLAVDVDGKILKIGRNLTQEELNGQKYMYCGVKKIIREDVHLLRKRLMNPIYHTHDLGYLLSDLCLDIPLYNYCDNRSVNINRSEELEEAYRKFFKKFIIVMTGYTAVGKSSLALKISEKMGIPIYHSALIRRELGLHPKNKEEADIFFNFFHKLRDEADRKVYKKLAENAVESLKDGKNVVLDAGFFFTWQRELLYSQVSEINPEIFIVRVVCNDEAEIKKRLEKRWNSFEVSPFNETPFWDSYVSSKSVTESLDKDRVPSPLIRNIIEYDSLTGKVQYSTKEKSYNLSTLLNLLKNIKNDDSK